MKNYEEIARDVLRRIDEYETERNMKRAKITKVVASVTPVCTAAAVGVGLWKGGFLTPAHTQLINNSVDSTVSNAEYIISKNSNMGNNQYISDTELTSEGTDIPGQTEKVDDSANGEDSNNNLSSGDNSKESAYNKTHTNTNLVSKNDAENTYYGVHTNLSVQQQNEPNTVISDTPTYGDSQNNGWCVFISSLEWNGITYHDNDTANVSAYTQDSYIGKVCDFNGEYQDNVGYRISRNDSVYTVKETSNVLLVVKSNGTTVVMTSPEWSSKGNEPEHLASTSIDTDSSDDETVTVFNGFCQ